ncbi:flagellar motor switch protein FliG [Caldinitratiruptor microaerophilus]|uniref:flagellar motor switch protein FliG n=1 Tax=Caldinitratiruptor microaerophilus TaxID=671077 RepID=UPI00223189A5|nr:flagellar motor switch protein FliG [Caldinitratiruptor microaerophilus]
MRQGKSASPRGLQKAAVFLIAIGPELAARVFRHMEQDEVELLSLEIARQRQVLPAHRDAVLHEFYQLAVAQEYISTGGLEYARALLERALGPAKAGEIVERLVASLQVRPFDFARKTDPSQLLSFLQGEHPQTIALVLAYLRPEQAATILSALPPERQVDVVRRIAIMDRTSPDVLQEIERVLERQVVSLTGANLAVAGGVDALVEVLNRVDRTTERTIVESLLVLSPDLAEEVKKRLFLFEDIVHLDDRSLQRVLREVDMNRDLPLALKTASDEVKQKIFRNISKRAGENLRENIELLGPVRLRDVEEAQAKIVNIIRRLEEQEEIVISRGGKDEVLV